MDFINPARDKSCGQENKDTWVDRLGNYLSERQVKRQLKRLKQEKLSVLDLGCGYHARLMRKLAHYMESGVCVDIALQADLKNIPNFKMVEAPIEQALNIIQPESFDVILMISVLEHLADPLGVLTKCKQCLKKDGLLFLNVPTWRGKVFLEWSAFVMRLSPAYEMDDHKMYFNKQNLWPLLVKAGFKPSQIHMNYHKFGLNLYARCSKEKR